MRDKEFIKWLNDTGIDIDPRDDDFYLNLITDYSIMTNQSSIEIDPEFINRILSPIE